MCELGYQCGKRGQNRCQWVRACCRNLHARESSEVAEIEMCVSKWLRQHFWEAHTKPSNYLEDKQTDGTRVSINFHQ